MANEFLKKVSDNWKAIMVIGTISVASVSGWNYAMAQAAETARKEVQAAVNKEMIDGAKKAAAEAVREQLPAIAKEVAQEVAKQVVEAQKKEKDNK